MNQAGLLLLLWDALQHRETTFGQVLDLSSACGLDGRRVLAEHLSSIGFASRHERSLAQQRVIVEREASGPIQSPNQRFASGGVRGGVMELFEKRSSLRRIHPNKCLRQAFTRQARDDVDHSPIAKKLVVSCIRQKVIGPLPISPAPVHGTGLVMGERLARLRVMEYAPAVRLSKLFEYFAVGRGSV